jgi:AraC-like DNA-binding protein
MSYTNYISHAGIFFTCTEKKELVSENIVPEHILIHVYSGKITVTTADKKYFLTKGQTALFSRNQLAKFVKEPVGEIACKSVTVFFTQEFLQHFYATQPLLDQKIQNPKIVQLKEHPLLDNLFQSIEGYSNLSESFLPDELTQLKVKEAITIVRTLDKNADLILSDFSEPHKIDLAAFMLKNFIFNISIPRFANLTGRSLATFKRDFKKTFSTSPQKWLTEKRLEQAHFLIAEKKQKPSEVYLDVGFENLSHFSSAFKQAFGYNPSYLMSL